MEQADTQLLLGIKPERPLFIQYQSTRTIAVVFEHGGAWWWTSNYREGEVHGPFDMDEAKKEAEMFVWRAM